MPIHFSAIDTARLFSIAERLISPQTISDIDAFRQHVQAAATIATEAALRILGCNSRAILEDHTAAAVSRTIEIYEEQPE